jgi:glutamate-ammonia-ligase adenylyltransferase
LQMVADRQTHDLPETDAGLRDFAMFLDAPDFLETFPKLLAAVHGHFSAFFDWGEDSAGEVDPGEHGKVAAPFAEKLTALGFKDVQHIAERVRDWAGGKMPALRSERARELLKTLLPRLLAALARQQEPDRAFVHFDTLISRQRAGVQLLSLFLRNPALLDRLAAVLGAAPALAEHLAQNAQALEALLVPEARFAAPKPLLRRLMREAADLEQAVAVTRRFVRREEFHLSVATLEGRLDADEAGRLRSHLAAAALTALLPPVMKAHEARYGVVPGAAFGVVALGKTGGEEMLAGSDLDLMLIYDHAPVENAPIQYFVRLANAFTGVLTARGPEGPIYQVDMRLRPSGNQGPVAVSLAAFERYHAAESWTWERMALTRASVLAATPGFGKLLRAKILEALARPVAEDKIKADAVAMLRRVNAELPVTGPWDVKHCIGGMMEVAFIAEALQLVFGPAERKLFRPNTAAAIKGLAAARHIAAADARALLKADFLWRTIQGIARITGLKDKESSPPAAMVAPLLRATGTADLAALRARMSEAGADVRKCFGRVIGGGAES